MTKKEFVQSERQFTVDLLKKLTPEQWKKSTLCEGWTVEDLAAHLVSRERNIVSGMGLVVPGLHSLHDSRIAKIKAKGHEYILSKLKIYPWYMPAVLNTGEFYVHNEDFLRGELNMKRPEPNNEAQEILWNSLQGLVRVKKSLVSDLGNVMLQDSKTSAVIIIANHNSTTDTAIYGRPSELLLYFYGRRAAAHVVINKAKL